jgi:TonB family protein
MKVSAETMLLAGIGSALAWCAVTSPSAADPHPVPLAQVEHNLRRAPSHISEFSPVASPLALPKCADVRPPEPLLTPDPLLQFHEDDMDVRVTFIVGTDGHVHSAFVLESGGVQDDTLVLSAIHSWRYRPALCNGVTTDSEALVRFRIHSRANSPTMSR